MVLENIEKCLSAFYTAVRICRRINFHDRIPELDFLILSHVKEVVERIRNDHWIRLDCAEDHNLEDLGDRVC